MIRYGRPLQIVVQVLSWLLVATSSASLAWADGTPVPPPIRTIPLSELHQSILLTVGERFVLDLGTGFVWTVSVANPAIVSASQGVYDAQQVGQTTLTVQGDPLCRQARPPCEAPSLRITTPIIVRPASSSSLVGDLNSDGVVNSLDLALFAQRFGMPRANDLADFNHDGVVNSLDLAIFTQNFGRSVP